MPTFFWLLGFLCPLILLVALGASVPVVASLPKESADALISGMLCAVVVMVGLTTVVLFVGAWKIATGA